MARAVHRRPVTWVAAFAVSVATLWLSTGRAVGAAAACQSVSPQVTSGSTPILFVHGINSGPWVWTPYPGGPTGNVEGTSEPPLKYIQTKLGNTRVTGYTFDWSKYATHPVYWVTDSPPSPNLGMRLADAVGCIARASGHKVIIVAWSMGGLIAKYASNLDATDIAAVFTMGTPYQGSWLASAAVGQDPDWVHELFVQAVSEACRLPGANQAPLIGPVCSMVNSVWNERNDSGVEAMRLNGGPNGWEKLSVSDPWPPGFPVYPLAASIQATWQPLWPLNNIQVGPAEDFGDMVVGTNSQLASSGPGTVSCPVRLGAGGNPQLAAAVTILDALATSPCWHWKEPDNKTLLDYIVSRAGPMLPTGGVGDWYNTSYTMTCGGAAAHPFTVTLKDGTGVAPGSGSYSEFEIHVEAVTEPGDLTGPGSAETAVLLYCSPQPSNFYNEEVQIFRPDGTLLTELPATSTLSPGSLLSPLYNSSQFSIDGGQLITGMKFYGPGDSHASGPSISMVVTWRWNGHQFVHSPISLPQAPACPQAGPGVPAGLVSAVAQQIGNQCGLEIDNLKTDPQDPSWVLFAISPTPGSTTQGGGGIAHEVNGTWPVVLTGSFDFWCSPQVPSEVVIAFVLPQCP